MIVCRLVLAQRKRMQLGCTSLSMWQLLQLHCGCTSPKKHHRVLDHKSMLQSLHVSMYHVQYCQLPSTQTNNSNLPSKLAQLHAIV